MRVERKRDAPLRSLCKQMMSWLLWQRQQHEGGHEATSFDPLAWEELVGRGVHGHPLHLVPPYD